MTGYWVPPHFVYSVIEQKSTTVRKIDPIARLPRIQGFAMEQEH